MYKCGNWQAASFPHWLKGYLVIVCFTVGQALAFVVMVSQEGFLTLSTHKMLQTNPRPSNMWLVRAAISQHFIKFWFHYQVKPQLDQFRPDVLLLCQKYKNKAGVRGGENTPIGET